MDDALRLTIEQKANWLKDQKHVCSIFHGTFDTDCGKEVLDWLSVKCLEHARTLSPGNSDVTAFNEGKRAVILMIRNILGAKPEEMIEL